MHMIYMDNAATTKVSAKVFEAMTPYLTSACGNPSSVYAYGREARKAVEQAREKVARALGAMPNEIYFTGCGTESDNWAIRGAAYARKDKGRHIITSSIEHHAVLHTCMQLEKEGFEVTYLPVDEYGLVSPESLEKAIRPDTTLVTIMTANNEIGTIQPIEELGRIAKEHNALMHTDAVQAIGSIPFDLKNMPIDMLSLSGHKFHAPKGVGALYIKKNVKIDNFMLGGQQERGHRAGTENVASIVGLGVAIEDARNNIERHNEYLKGLRDHMIDKILTKIPDTRLNGHATKRLPGNVNVSIRYIEGESLLLSLDIRGIAASSGSACTSGSLDPSHVLLAIGLPHEIAHGSLRFSLSEDNTIDEVDTVVDELCGITAKLRDMSPLYDRKG
ncbi:MAG: cysteine desulfurase NifS [Clostridia bacterium]|nr:cysteine desulfurase NifS [Clostridia bacterium]